MHPTETIDFFKVELDGPWDRAYAEEWLPVTFRISRNSTEVHAIRLSQIKCDDQNVTLDIDMFQHGLQIRPGETYRFQVPIQVNVPKEVELSGLRIAFEFENDTHRVLHWQSAGKAKFEVKPSLKQLLDVRIDSLCAYEEGTKVLMSVRHKGATPLVDLAIDLGPSDKIAAGKPNVRKPRLDTGEVENVELVVRQTSLDAVISALVGGKMSIWRQTLSITNPPAAVAKWFRFFEPRRLTKDTVNIVVANTKQAVRQDHSIYLLDANSLFKVMIRPAHKAVNVTLRDIPMLVHIRKSETKNGFWVFTLEVLSPGIFRKPERLFYEVETNDEKMTGEFPICVLRTLGHYAQVALQLGAFSFLGGTYGVWTWWLTQGGEWEKFEILDVLRLLVIPFVLLAYWVVDWLQYQLFK